MKIRYFLGAVVLVLSFAIGASAQESEVSGGGGGGITAAPGSGTAGTVPKFASATSLEDSIITQSGVVSVAINGSDAATNTVTDALILRHATSDAGFGQNGFGTGLLFQGEDGAGNMQSMGSIDAVYTSATDGAETTSLVFSTYLTGVEAAGAMRLDYATNQAKLHAPVNFSLLSDTGYLELNAGGANPIYASTNGTVRWSVLSTGHFEPFATNTYDIGTSSALVRNNYVSTSIQGTRTQAITDNAAAATFVTIAVPTSNTTVGGRIFYTITAIDAGTAIQTKTGTYSFGLNNIGGTVTGAGTDVLEHSQLSVGTLAPTFSVNISSTNAQFQLVLDTSLDAGAETLKIEYRVQIDSGTATVTPAT